MERYSFMAVHEPAVDRLELRLGNLDYGLAPSCSAAAADTTVSIGADSASQLLNEQRQQITIFYNGRISVSDVTNFQARVIMDMAKNEMENKNKCRKEDEDKEATAGETEELQSMLSMKRSLQRFLQKRKARMANHSSPYAHSKPLQLF